MNSQDTKWSVTRLWIQVTKYLGVELYPRHFDDLWEWRILSGRSPHGSATHTGTGITAEIARTAAQAWFHENGIDVELPALPELVRPAL